MNQHDSNLPGEFTIEGNEFADDYQTESPVDSPLSAAFVEEILRQNFFLKLQLLSLSDNLTSLRKN